MADRCISQMHQQCILWGGLGVLILSWIEFCMALSIILSKNSEQMHVINFNIILIHFPAEFTGLG